MRLRLSTKNFFKTKYWKDPKVSVEPLEVCPYCSVWFRGESAKKLIENHIDNFCTRKLEGP